MHQFYTYSFNGLWQPCYHYQDQYISTYESICIMNYTFLSSYHWSLAPIDHGSNFCHVGPVLPVLGFI